MAEVNGERRPRKRRGGLISFLVLLIVLFIGLVVLDRVGASYAEGVIADRVAAQVADQKGTSSRPDVAIEGVPFLTQVARGDYREIHIQLRDFAGPAGNGKSIKLPLLDVHARDVNAPLGTLRSGQGEITAGTITGTGTIDYATLAALTERDGVKLAEKGGKLAVTAPLTVLNQNVTVNGTAAVEVAGANTVRVRFDEVTAEGLPDVPLVRNALTNYAKQLAIELKVPALPLSLKLEKAVPTPQGLAVTATAADVPLNAAG